MSEEYWPLHPPMPKSHRRALARRILAGEFNQVHQVLRAGDGFEELTLRTRPPGSEQ